MDLVNIKTSVEKYFNAYIKNNIDLPPGIKENIFPGTFLSSEHYLIFPYFFQEAFGNSEKDFANMLGTSGYFYFKYLICIDSLVDRDVAEHHENFVPEGILLLRAHVYHEESIKLLSILFPGKSPFWQKWKKRNRSFYDGVLLDKRYDTEMNFGAYKALSAGKCSFLKATIDAFFYRSSQPNKKLYRALISSFDHLSIARCLQDDFEDFKKDLLHRKNNYAHVLLKQWLIKEGKTMENNPPDVLEKYFFISKTAEEILEKSKIHFNRAIETVSEFSSLLPGYIRYIEAFRNKSNLLKVNIEAYRITRLIEKVKVPVFARTPTTAESIAKAGSYITKMQNTDGSWYDISNKQGLSNIWSTGFIAMNLKAASAEFRRAAAFLSKHKQHGLWGYNQDWIPDFDSATCSISVLHRANYSVEKYLDLWLRGQGTTGGFSTYGIYNKMLLSYLGIQNNLSDNDWTKEHVCVSALAYYFLCDMKNRHPYENSFTKLKNFLLQNISAGGIWKPYWWTSVIYPTTFVVKGMLKENKKTDRTIVNRALKFLLGRQTENGSFKCDLLNTESVFYTSLVLDTLCHDGQLFNTYARNIEKMKDWILSKQYTDGSFENSNFLVIPNLTSGTGNGYESLKINTSGGTGSITGEIAGLFTTATAYKALSGYEHIKSTKR